MPQSSMEQEALERVRRMYGGFDTRGRTRHEPLLSPAEKEETEKTEEKEDQPQPLSMQKEERNLLDELLKDNERSLILLLLLVLYSEKADSSLLLALMYLIL